MPTNDLHPNIDSNICLLLTNVFNTNVNNNNILMFGVINPKGNFNLMKNE